MWVRGKCVCVWVLYVGAWVKTSFSFLMYLFFFLSCPHFFCYIHFLVYLIITLQQSCIFSAFMLALELGKLPDNYKIKSFLRLNNWLDKQSLVKHIVKFMANAMIVSTDYDWVLKTLWHPLTATYHICFIKTGISCNIEKSENPYQIFGWFSYIVAYSHDCAFLIINWGKNSCAWKSCILGIN